MITNQVEQSLYTTQKMYQDLTKLLGNDGKEIYPIYPQEAMFLTKFSNKTMLLIFLMVLSKMIKSLSMKVL